MTRKEIELKLNEAKRIVKSLEGDLRRAENECIHNSDTSLWTVEYAPIVREAYYSPGDPPGTMGIDRRLPSHFPREEKERWKRTCKKCGKVEYTEYAIEEKKITKIPRF